jgi:hypothetical protein
MSSYLVTCKTCGAEFEPSREAIKAGAWRLCPMCAPAPTKETSCRECGRVLRATKRELCLRCMGVSVL